MRTEKKGFSLVEILVILTILAILATVILMSVDKARSLSRDAQRLADIKQLQLALDNYYNTNGHYPISGNCSTTSPSTGWCNSVQAQSGGRWIRDNGVAGVLSPFTANEPIDPKQGSAPNWLPTNGGTYFYYANAYGGAGDWYMIVFGLENYPHDFELQDGVIACDGTNFHYGNNANGIITVGVSC